MSLTAFAAPLAQRLVTAAGFAVTFARSVAQPIDPISNTQPPPVVTTWPGTAIWSTEQRRGDPTVALSQGTGQFATRRTLLVSGLTVSTRPQAGDTVNIAGVVFTVADVTHVGDADGGAVPAYRVAVRA